MTDRGVRSARPHALACAACVVWLALSGCAGGPWIIDAQVEPFGNPESGPLLRLGTVRDARVFRPNPPDTMTPSLYQGSVDDPSLTGRALARRVAPDTDRGRGGNVWLPEGRTVSDLAGEAITRALRMQGYRVVPLGDPRFGSAAPVDIDVVVFWGRNQPDAGGVRLDFHGQLFVRAPIPHFERGLMVCANYVVGSGGSSGHVWKRLFDGGLDALAEKMRTRMVYGRGRYC